MQQPSSEEIDRFWSKVTKGPHCWEWAASITLKGYGQMRIRGPERGRPELAHRISFFLANGPIPDKAFICHRCDNRRCVRPEHLFAGSHSDNMRDMVKKGRWDVAGPIVVHSGDAHYRRQPGYVAPHGEAVGGSKLTDADIVRVRELRQRLMRMDAIARLFGVSKSTIFRVLHRATWKHVA